MNNLRGLIRLFDCLFYREDFIQLPGDEIVEKKHANIKTLTAQLQKQETGKRITRKWPGLGPSPFDIDLATLFDVKEFKGNTFLLKPLQTKLARQEVLQSPQVQLSDNKTKSPVMWTSKTQIIINRS